MSKLWQDVFAVVGIALLLGGLVGLAACGKSKQFPTTLGWVLESPLPGGNSVSSVWGSSPSDVFAVGTDGTILHYDGSTWSAMVSGTANDLYSIWGSSHSDIFAVGWNGTILHYDGSAWSTMSSGTTSNLADVWGSSPSDVFAVGWDGAILHYDGSTWSAMSSTSNCLCGVWGSSPSDVFAVGISGTILHYNGSSWSPMVSGTTMELDGVWGSSSSDVFIVGIGGTILHYNGSTWSAMSSGTKNELFGVWGSSPSDVFAVGWNGTILHYNGSTWSPMSSGTTNALEVVWGSSSTDVFAVGWNGTILHYGYRHASTTTVASSQNPSTYGDSVTFTATVSAATGTSTGIVQFSIDGTDFGDPVTLSGGSATSGITTTLSVGTHNIMAVYSGDANFAASSGTLLQTVNQSPTTSGWVLQNTVPEGNNLSSVWGSSPSDVFAVGHMGTILHYE
jgi:hypothetical protein